MSLVALARRTADEHPDWCRRGHHCGLGEHRAAPITLHVPGRASLVLTRVLAATGRQHVEVTTSIGLADDEPAARAHLARVLAEITIHLWRLARLAR